MVISPSWSVTTSCAFERSLPAASACRRRRWTESITLDGSSMNASPRLSVQSSWPSIMCRTCGNADQGLHAGIPGLLVERRGEIIAAQRGVGWILKPPVGVDDFEGIACGHQDLPQQVVRIERNRRQHLIELRRGEGRGGLIRRGRLGGRLSGNRGRPQEAGKHGARDGPEQFRSHPGPPTRCQRRKRHRPRGC